MKVCLLATAALGLAGCTTTGATTLAPITGDLLVADVTVIDPASETVLSGQDVLIANGRILHIAAHDSRTMVADETIEADGQYLIPGLADMHSHSHFAPILDHTLNLQHANGVTMVREMGSDCVEPGGMDLCLTDMREVRAEIAAGERVGPRIMELASAKVDMNRREDASGGEILYRPVDAESAVATVAGLEARGAEIIKISQDFTPEVFEALMDAAKAEGMRTGGHIPMAFSVAEVANMGLTSIEHARDLPMDCAPIGAEIRDHMKRKLSGEDLPWPDRKSIPGRTVAEFDPALCAPHIEAMVANGTYYVPTHPTRAMDYRAGDEEYRADPRLAYIPKMQQRFWNRDMDRTAENLGEIQGDLEGFYKLGLVTTKMARDAGVKVMVGTDANDTMVFPGFSVHDEIANFVEAGLTPMQALAAATSVPAEYFGASGDYGSVSEGKVADLVLLSADPLADIDNTTAIEAVIQGGRVSDRAALDAILAKARQYAANAGPPGQ